MVWTKDCEHMIAIFLSFLIIFINMAPLTFCKPGGGYGPNEMDILWHYDLDAPSFGSAATADIDGDGLLEIVFGTYFNDEHVYALNAEDGSLLWKYNTGGCNDASPVIADVDLDGDLEVIIPSSSPYEVYCFNGANGTVEWSRSTGYPNCIDSPPAIADLDNDEKPEIVFGTFYGYVFCLNGENGTICWQINLGTDSYIQSCPNILDLNNDGQLDVVVAQYSGACEVFALRGNNGSTLWHSNIPQDYMYHGGSFADIDEDGLPEIVIGSYDGQVYVFNGEDGSILWNYQAPYYIGAPTSLADLNNDGHLEIVFTSHNYLGVLTYFGNLSWSYTAGGSIFRGASICDTDGDGVLDIIFGSEDGYLRSLRGDNGSVLWSWDLEAHYGNTFQIDHAPILDDFDNDGMVDVFCIGGYGISNPESANHGRAYAIHAGNGTGPGWPMFRHDRHHSACFHYQLEPSTVYVDDDAVPNWYDAIHVRTIQEGIDNVSFGGAVFVYNGTYYENPIVNKTIKLIGELRESTIIDGSGNGDVLTVIANDVRITNVTIQHSGDDMWQDKAVRISGDNTIFNNNIVIDNAGALLVSSCVNCTVENNKFFNSSHDVMFYKVNNSTFINNTVSNCRLMIIDNSHLNKISSNQIINTGGGFYVHLSSYNTFSGNNLSNNGIYPYGGYGLLLELSSCYNLIESNCICNNTDDGIWIYSGSNNNKITKNYIGSNGIGISFGNEIVDNKVFHNNFVNNLEYNARDYGLNEWDNGYPSGGNYWDDYMGYDANGDGIGDVPYEIIGGNNQDNYPLMVPFSMIDINQSTFNRGFPIRHALDGDWGAAQSFIPTLHTLTSAESYMRKFGTPEFNLIVELRENHPQGPLVNTLVFTPEEVTEAFNWFPLDFTDTIITPGTQYFIVCPPAPSGVTTSFGYEWAYAFGDQYNDGAFWFTRNSGTLWRDLPTMYEFAFKTYGYV